MKLFFCPECADIRKLHKQPVKCICGKSWGQYIGYGKEVVVGGEAMVLGIDNKAFAAAYRLRRGAPWKQVDLSIWFFNNSHENITYTPNPQI